MKAHARTILGLLAGVVAGAVGRQIAPFASFIDWIQPAGTLFIKLITMVVVPLVIASVFVGVASLGDIRRLGRIGGRTLAYFLGTTLAAAVIAVAVALAMRVGTGLDPAVRDAITSRYQSAGATATAGVSSVQTFSQMVLAMVPANPLAAAAQGDLLAVIFTVVVFGAAATTLTTERRAPLVAFFTSVNDVSLVVIQAFMTLAPYGVAILIAGTVLRSSLDLLWSLASYTAVVVLALAIHIAIVLIPLLRFVARVGLGSFLRATSDALLLAFSTASSSVTLPVSLAAARDRLGISTAVASFVLPSGTTLNKNGAAVYKAVTAVFLAHLYGVSLEPWTIITIILTTIVASSAGAGVPGSSLVTTLIVLNAIGLGASASAGIALVAGIDRPLDMCRTATNTFSNLVGAAVVARAEGEKLTAG